MTNPTLAPDDGDFDDFTMTDELREALKDAELRSSLLDSLVDRRRTLGLSQKTVAERMETTQSTISEFEHGATDPFLSTLQRYARAVDAELAVTVKPAHRAPVIRLANARRSRIRTSGRAATVERNTAGVVADMYASRHLRPVPTYKEMAS
ncbi:MAG: XRE family transcriptional regulator [Actinomyces ruminicola]|uniref:Helix-turn-helix domain-containing protein n=1 Tax=Actinomyces ruminicola TaxID=332524 RepID=A0A1G9S3Y9_9ACTO|nr:helix-turn-helix transcriptional regulator [Actinomyces ruminicola]MBE6482999.1 XRE family transcriptional regulator [Actinomyces ruminicola]SDM30111.1 Helix-turn-helix domain-containing protein [Actinomyces ruminicola]